MRVYAREGREVLLQQVVGTYYEILLFIAVNHDVRHLQVTVYGRRKLLVHRKHLKGVADRDGIEDGLQVVVTVWTALNDVKSEVDLADRMSYHIYGFTIYRFTISID
jgi:hypothetical protein